MIASNVGELIEILKTLDPAGVVMTTEPPFDGVKVIPQGNGSILFCRPRESDSKAQPASPLGEYPVPEPVAKLLRLCVKLNLKPEDVK